MFYVQLLQRYARSPTVVEQLRSAQAAAQKPRSVSATERITPQPVRKRLSRSEHPEIVAAYQAGATTEQLAQRYEVSRTYIQNLLHRNGARLRRRPLTPEQLERVRDLHAAGLSTYAIARELDTAQSIVWRAVRMHTTLAEPVLRTS